jgi:hypothetical protein
MWQLLQKFFDKYTLFPNFIVGFDASTKTFFRRNGKEGRFAALQLGNTFVQLVLLIWFNYRKANNTMSLYEADNHQKSLAVTFALLLIPCCFTLYIVCWWTINLNESNFTSMMNALIKFDAKLQGFKNIEFN